MNSTIYKMEENQIAEKEGRLQAPERGKCVLMADHEVGGQRLKAVGGGHEDTSVSHE